MSPRRLALSTLLLAICGLALAVGAPSRDTRSSYTIVAVNADGTGRRNLTAGTPARLVLRALSPDGRTLAYDRRRVEGGSDLWSIEVVPAGGGTARILVSFPDGSASAPTWSRDGKLVAFDGPHGIGVVRPDGTPFSTISGVSDPAWLPGARLAFLGPRDIPQEIETADPDGSERRTVLGARPFEEFAALSASPNGRKFAFRSFSDEGDWLYSVGLPGIPLSQISKDVSAFSWSPTGNRLALVTGRGLVTVLPDGTRRRPYRATRILSPAVPAWSPDGTRIAFASISSTLMVMNVRRGSLRVVARGVDRRQPLWSPNGRRLYYVALRG